MTLDRLPIGLPARIIAVDWSTLVDEEAQRLRALGIDDSPEALDVIRQRLARAGVDASEERVAKRTGFVARTTPREPEELAVERPSRVA